jgi:hypothetical protein
MREESLPLTVAFKLWRRQEVIDPVIFNLLHNFIQAAVQQMPPQLKCFYVMCHTGSYSLRTTMTF